MSTTEQIAQAKQSTQEAAQQLLTLFRFVPDDRLDWSPSETSRTALHLVSHCGMSNRAFAGILRGEMPPLPADPAEAAKFIRAAGREIATREEAVALLESSVADVLKALDEVTEDQIGTTPELPVGKLPFTVWMQVPANHMQVHIHQLGYLQTIWGDLQDH